MVKLQPMINGTQGRVKKILEGRLDLISSPSPSVKIQIMAAKVLFKNLGFKSPPGRVIFFAIFLSIFTSFIFSIKN